MKHLMNILITLKTMATGLLKVFATKQTVVLTLSISGLWFALKQAFIRDHLISWELTIALMSMVLMDTGLGFLKHLKLKTVSSSGFSGFMIKLLLYWCILKVGNWLSLIPFFGMSGDVIICGMMVREAISIAENIEVIRPGTFPQWIVKRLKDFDDDGKVNESNKGT
jgi:phage-related holin